MPLGGGTFLTQNKILPGSYINFVSAARASATLSERGIVAIPVALDWGDDSGVFEVTAEDFLKDSFTLLGYPYDHAKMIGFREVFKYAKSVWVYKLMKNGVAASNTYATAKFKGVVGNLLQTIIAVNPDDAAKSDVSTYYGTTLVDFQTVTTTGKTDALADNDWVIWKTNVALTPTAGLALTNGSQGDALTGTEYSAALDAFESVNFNVLACLTSDATTQALFVAYTERMRDDLGVKIQTVVYRKNDADHEGIISVENTVTDGGADAFALVWWVAGAEAGCEINRSLTNKVYNGEFSINVTFTQSALEAALLAGKFMFHRVGATIRVLEDINTFLTVTDEKSDDFKSNQTIRVIDQIANDIATLFNGKYLGNVPNDAAGRISLWNDIVTHHQQLQDIRAIENFSPDNVTVERGDTKKSVVVTDVVTPVSAMAQLYMTIVVS